MAGSEKQQGRREECAAKSRAACTCIALFFFSLSHRPCIYKCAQRGPFIIIREPQKTHTCWCARVTICAIERKMMGSGSKYLPYYYFLIMYRAPIVRERKMHSLTRLLAIHAMHTRTLDYLYRNLTTTSGLGKLPRSDSSRRSRHYF